LNPFQKVRKGLGYNQRGIPTPQRIEELGMKKLLEDYPRT
jgi:hypothetical protein